MVDISAGATLTIPDAGAGYVSVMVINQDHYINRVLHQPGVHELTVDEFDTPYVLVGPAYWSTRPTPPTWPR